MHFATDYSGSNITCPLYLDSNCSPEIKLKGDQVLAERKQLIQEKKVRRNKIR
jgi:hypothetical protein